jgi:hypothetical protein
MSRRGLQTVLSVMGAVAALEGARGVLRGTDQVLDGGRVSANVDSEYRFYSSWYFVVGVLLLRAARHPESATTMVRAAGTGSFVAACGRVLSMRSQGPPHPLQKVLMAVEFAIPALIVPWQATVARKGGSGT